MMLAPRAQGTRRGAKRRARACVAARSEQAWASLRPASTPRAAKPARNSRGRRPLLVIDGDSFAHRAYHALPKSIRRKGDKPAGAILGFANLLLRLYREERPRAVLVGWDTYEEPTYRHEAFAAYQSGREFDDDVIEQLAVIPDFVAACGFANAQRAGYEADDFLAAAAAAEERRGGRVLVASGDRDTFQLASPKTTILYPIRGGGVERIGPGRGARTLRRRSRTGAGLHRAARRSVRQIARRAGSRCRRRRGASAKIPKPGGDPQGRPFCGAGRRASALSCDCHHESQGAAAASCRPDADLGEGGRARAVLAAHSNWPTGCGNSPTHRRAPRSLSAEICQRMS